MAGLGIMRFNSGVSIEGEVIGNSRFDCLDIFSKEYAILHAISEIDRSGFKSVF